MHKFKANARRVHISKPQPAIWLMQRTTPTSSSKS